MFGNIKEVMKGYLGILVGFVDTKTRHSSETFFSEGKTTNMKLCERR